MTDYRLGIMGGTFDPIHHGHLACASEVAYLLGLDEVVFVPAGRPWQKRDRAVSPAADRLAMVTIAVADDARFAVSPVEVDRAGPTYTRDTLVALRERRPDAELYFIAGTDALAGLPTWRHPDELLRLARFVGVTRPGYDQPAPPGVACVLDVPALDISSSDCRSRVRRGAPITYLVPDGVVRYIAERGLYRGTEEN